MITKRIAISFLTVVGILALVAALAVAAFSDDASITDNTLSTGNANLQIADVTGSCGTFTDSITGFNGSNLAPGDSVSKDFCLRNSSDSNIDLDVAVSGITVDGSSTLDASLVALSISCGVETPVIGTVATPSASVFTTLEPTQEKECTLTATLDSEAGNEAANKSIDFDVTFTGTQAD